jgi:hypothetical protein
MNLFTALLWKEWRDHRAALLGYFIGIPPLIAWGISVLEAPMRKAPLLPSAAAVGGFAIAALTLFGDLFANEEQRGTIKLLRRLPSGLSKVFLGKISFALVAALAMSAWAYLAMTCASAWLYGGPLLPKPSLPEVEWLAPVVPMAAWMSVAAIWLSRATLALPTAALTLALFSAPIWFTMEFHSGLRPTSRELQIAFVVLTLTGPLVAGASFVLGRRRMSRAFVPATVGLLATLALFTPAYAWTGMRVARWLAIEPGHSSFRFDTSSESVLSRNGRFAYVPAFHLASERNVRGRVDHDSVSGDSPLHPLCIDLESGAWREIGEPASRFLAPESGGGPRRWRIATPLVGLFDESAFGQGAVGKRVSWQVIDADRGVQAGEELSNCAEFGSGPEVAALLRVATHIELPDGRRAWRRDGQLWIDPGRPLPDSRPGSSARYQFWHFAAAGLGVRIGGSEWYDVVREKRFRVADDLWVQWVRPGRWIVSEIAGGYIREVRLYDPETGAREPFAALGKLDEIVDLAPDGRLLVVVKQDASREQERSLILLDPENGAREEIARPDSIDGHQIWMRVAGRTPAGKRVLRIENYNKGIVWFAVIEDGERAEGSSKGARSTKRLVTTSPLVQAELVGASDEESLIAIDEHRRLVRVRFDGSAPKLLFPKPDGPNGAAR